MRIHHAALLLGLCASFNIACDSPTAPSVMPMVATPPAVVSPPSGIVVAGKVYDTANRVLAGAVVEVVDGPSAGLIAVTNGTGDFSLRGDFDASTHFRATRFGHTGAVRQMGPRCDICHPNFWVYFNLEIPVPPADIAGDYTLTVIPAVAGCTALPEHARRRTYSATVSAMPTQPTSANTFFSAQISGVVSGLGFDELSFAVAGDDLQLYMGDLHGQPGLLEMTAPNAYFSIGGLGAARVSADGASIVSSSFEGEITHCELKPGLEPLVNGRFNCAPERAVSRVICGSSQLILTRR